MRTIVSPVRIIVVVALAVRAASGAEYPGPVPGAARVSTASSHTTLANETIAALWDTREESLRLERVSDPHEPEAGAVFGGQLFFVVLRGGHRIAASEMPRTPVEVVRLSGDAEAARAEARLGGHRIAATFTSPSPAFTVAWSAELRDGSNSVTMRAVLTAGPDGLPLEEFIVLDVRTPGAAVCGQVDGSPVVAGRWFLACEHPLAVHRVEGERVTGGRARPALKAGQAIELEAAIGVTPAGQLRRGFLYHLERRRAYPYRPYLHCNSWYHLNIGRPDSRMTEAEAIEAVEHIGRELVRKREVTLDAFVWDDGWDDFNSLWGFHDGFPDGFASTRKAAEAFGAAQGVWMSPWGGYGRPKEQRVAYGRAQGYEMNSQGFAMAGANYGAAFRDVCLDMMRRYGVGFFKFDGMGAGNVVSGAREELADDVDAVLRLAGELRAERPDLFISATVGTWPSPYWTFHADSVWRQLPRALAHN